MGLLNSTGAINLRENATFHQVCLTEMRSYRKTNRVLDVGCGIGLFLAAARGEQWECIGIDPSGPLSAYGRENFNLSISQSELADMNFPANYFDVITLWDVTEHLLEPKTVYQEIYRILRPGGLLMFRMPNWNNIARELLGPRWDMFVTDHFSYFTPATMTKLLEQTGFTPKYIEARELVGSEIEELTKKINAEAAQAAIKQLRDLQAPDKGSTITGSAEKRLTTQDRIAKAVELIKTANWANLVREIKNYLIWKLHRRKV